MTNLAGIELANPVLLASGTAGYGLELDGLLDMSRLGGLILKSVTIEPWAGNAEPRIWETTGGMLNSIGLENIGVEALIEDVLPRISEIGVPLMASIAGDTVRAFARLASRLESTGALAAVEVNVSCPNVERGGIQFGVDPNATAAVTTSVRENCTMPVFVKLSAAASDLPGIADAASRAGASGLSLINTVPGMAIDPVSRSPRLGNVTGGLSGPAIKPIALKAVYDCFRATGLPIIGGGGIYDAGDVIEFLLAGATAVSIGTATFQDPARATKIVEELPDAVTAAGATTTAELVGRLRTPRNASKGKR
ncbi:MAG: dihydroorotate dehydrogenase [Actinobacteria bacterium]|nr:dihydroorotate dehydrogenase [Actinomycetota bacterium]MBU1942212.1 dihydroorotate dehydrogenase [Actinomycetota bacterium]MBU2687439.1 dihydroorotate dehydrogenase [Actinomycetota bacterium]